jgi:hypothetical protein
MVHWLVQAHTDSKSLDLESVFQTKSNFIVQVLSSIFNKYFSINIYACILRSHALNLHLT